MGKGSSGEGGQERCAQKLRSSTEAERSCRQSKRKMAEQQVEAAEGGRRQQQDFGEGAFQHLSEFVTQDAQVLLWMAACPARALWKRKASQFPKTKYSQSCKLQFLFALLGSCFRDLIILATSFSGKSSPVGLRPFSLSPFFSCNCN